MYRSRQRDGDDIPVVPARLLIQCLYSQSGNILRELHTRSNNTQTHHQQCASKPSLLLTLLILFTTALAVKSKWNSLLQVNDIGFVRPKPNQPNEPVSSPGSCGCGRFQGGMRAIYRCTNGQLQIKETCRKGNKNDMCVRNSRKKGKAFYPFEIAEDVVCVQSKDAKKP
jgi:hypothetical protein